MTRSEEIKTIVARLYAARKSGDVDASLRFFADDATFAIERGEHVALVGPNGSGTAPRLSSPRCCHRRAASRWRPEVRTQSAPR